MSAVLSVARDIVEAMIYLHDRGVIHGDLKPSNILLKTIMLDGSPVVQAKVSDFGTAVLLEDGQTSRRYFGGTPTHMAPEVLTSATVCKVSPEPPSDTAQRHTLIFPRSPPCCVLLRRDFAVRVYSSVSSMLPPDERSTEGLSIP